MRFEIVEPKEDPEIDALLDYMVDLSRKADTVEMWMSV